MSINRFEKIRQYFHSNDNSKNVQSSYPNYDKLYKVRPVVDSVLKKCREIPPEEVDWTDEQIIPTKGCSSINQYFSNKPNKWGVKVWARCGISGVVYDFEVYTGKNSTKKDNEIEGILMGGNAVYCLTQTLPLNKNYKIFFDNFFSSTALLKQLKKEGLLAVATLGKDRLKDAEKFLKSEKEFKKK